MTATSELGKLRGERRLMSPSDDATVPVPLHSRSRNAVHIDPADATMDGQPRVPDVTVTVRKSLVSPGKGSLGAMESQFVLPKCPLPPHDEFHPVETFVANAIASRESEQDSTQEYRAILDCLRNRKDPPMLFKVLLALRTSGSSLYQLTSSSKTHAHLLHLLFRLDPFLPCEDRLQDPILDYSLADAHLHLILALVSANSVFLTPGMNALWRLAHQDLEDAPMERTRRVHAALATMLRLCPKGNSDLFPVLASNFPFRTKPANVLVWYTKQCLAVLQYVPTLSAQVLELIVDKCLEMDVEIKINKNGQVSIEKEVHDAQDEMFELDLDEPDSNEMQKQDVEEKVDEMADKLDSLMHVLFEHIRAQANSTEYGAQGVYQMISPVFDSSVLTTHRSKFVQFVVFVVCGLENEGVSLDREFAAKLIDIVLDPYRATVTRQSGACYLASFMSRASYVSPETICEAISALLRWAEAYMLSLGEYGARASDVRDQCDLHSLFYTVCQASFYMMCFRGTEAMQYYRSAMEYHSTHSVNELEPNVEIPYADPEHVDIGPARWAKICGHELQPLRFCLESVRGEFLHVANVFQLLPPQLLERLAADDLKMSTAKMSTAWNKPRKSAIITTAATLAKRRMKGGVGGLGRGSNPLDSFFPFDPYLLRRSHIFVDPFYKNWEGGVDCHYHDGDDDDANEEEEEGAYNDDDSESSGDDASISEEDEGEKGTHMPQSMDSAAYVGPMSHASNATFMSSSTKSSFQLGTPEIPTKKQLQQEAWSETLKRPRASSIENGSW